MGNSILVLVLHENAQNRDIPQYLQHGVKKKSKNCNNNNNNNNKKLIYFKFESTFAH